MLHETPGHDVLAREEAVNLTVNYLLLARELARRDMAHAMTITGLPRSFLETLAQTTIGAIRRCMAAFPGTVVFVPRMPVQYWDQLATILRDQSVPSDMLAGYAAALSIRFNDKGEGGQL